MAKKETDIYLGGGSNINIKTASIVSVQNIWIQYRLVIIHLVYANHHQRKNGGKFGKQV